MYYTRYSSGSKVNRKNVYVIDDRGNVLDKNNIRERLSIRDTQKDFREMGIFNEKQKAFDAKTINKFANAFDKAITDLKKRK